MGMELGDSESDPYISACSALACRYTISGGTYRLYLSCCPGQVAMVKFVCDHKAWFPLSIEKNGPAMLMFMNIKLLLIFLGPDLFALSRVIFGNW